MSKSGFKVDEAGFKRQVKEFAKRHHQSFKILMRDQMRLYSTDLAKRFPPSKKLFGADALAAMQARVGNQTDRRMGDKAVESGVRGVIQAATPADMAWAETFGELAALRAGQEKRVFKRHSDGAVWLVDKDLFMPTADQGTIEAFHNSKRSSTTGHTTRAGQYTRNIGRWKASIKMIVEERSLRKYIKTKQRDVGKLKGGWVRAIQYFGGKTPANWISRHASGYAGGQINSNGSGTLWAINGVDYASRYRRVQVFAESVRRKDLIRKAKRLHKELTDKENRRKA